MAALALLVSYPAAARLPARNGEQKSGISRPTCGQWALLADGMAGCAACLARAAAACCAHAAARVPQDTDAYPSLASTSRASTLCPSAPRSGAGLEEPMGWHFARRRMPAVCRFGAAAAVRGERMWRGAPGPLPSRVSTALPPFPQGRGGFKNAAGTSIDGRLGEPLGLHGGGPASSALAGSSRLIMCSCCSRARTSGGRARLGAPFAACASPRLAFPARACF